MKIEELPKALGGPQRARRGRRGCRVSPCAPKDRPWVVNICVNGVVHYLGYAATKAEGEELFRLAYKHVYGVEPWPSSDDRSAD